MKKSEAAKISKKMSREKNKLPSNKVQKSKKEYSRKNKHKNKDVTQMVFAYSFFAGFFSYLFLGDSMTFNPAIIAGIGILAVSSIYLASLFFSIKRPLIKV